MKWIGQAAAPQDAANLQAWGDYVGATRDNMNAAWSRAVVARETLKDVRERLGLPFMVEAGETTARLGAWDAGLEQDFLELGSMVGTLSRFADESLAGRRRLGTDTSGTLGFERLPGDFTRVEVRAGRPVEIENATGEPVRVTGTVGALPPLAIAAIVIAAALATYFVVEQVCETVENVAEQKTFETISDNQTKQIERGATPEQAKALTDSLYKGATALRDARARETTAGRSEIPQTIRTVGFIALGLAAAYLVFRFLGRGGGAPALAPARALLGNPVRRSGEARVRIEYDDATDSYQGVITWPGDRWQFAQLRPPRSGVAGGPPVPGLDIAVDDPRAYDYMARAALSFGADEREELFSVADYDFDRGQFVVRRR
jgi:hypothetical protein